MKRFYLSLILGSLLCLLLQFSAQAYTNIKLIINGQTSYPDSQIIDGRTFMPVTIVANNLGISNSNIKWESATQTVTLTKEDKTVEMTIGSTILLVNGSPTVMDVYPQIVNSRTMLPCSFLANALGYSTKWDPVNNAIIINTNNPNTDSNINHSNDVNETLLVKSGSPLTQIMINGGKWYDDFAVSGASDSRYSISNGTKTVTDKGIILRTAPGQSGYTWGKQTRFLYQNFFLEMLLTPLSGSYATKVRFRHVNDQNELYLSVPGKTTTVRLYKVVNGTETIIYQKSDTMFSGKEVKVGIKALGTTITIYIDGVLWWSGNVIDFAEDPGLGPTWPTIEWTGWDPVNGVAACMLHYLAIEPL